MPHSRHGSRRLWLCGALALSCSGHSLPSLCNARATGPGYPVTPKAPPPLPPPPGQGTSLHFERYIVVDQFGYRPGMTKVAVLADPERGWNASDSYRPGPTLEVRRWSDGALAWSGAPSVWQGGAIDEASGDRGAWLDFSALTTPGLYYVFDPKEPGRSHPFEIADDVYRKVLRSAVRMYYFNRANFEKKPPYSCSGKRCWSLGVDYLGPGQDGEARSVAERDNAQTARDLRGGWWDAGDSNKYVTFSSDAVHQLLTAYEEHPAAFTDDFGIPESGNGIPDLIDEVLVELAWLERMQPPDLGGGALVKVGVIEHGEPTPDRSKLRRYYYPGACSSATIAVAGEFGHAARVARRFPGLAAKTAEWTRRAREAWRHFHEHPKRDTCDDGTIKAGDADRSLLRQDQEAVVAAVHLFALTADPEFGAYVSAHYRETRPWKEDRWSAYEPAQGDALLDYAALPNADPDTKRAILARKLEQLATVDINGFRPELDLYRAYMRKDAYHWGSNSQRASYGNTNYDALVHGLVASADRARYEERALGLLHAFHGVNPLGLVYLSNMYADGGDFGVDSIFHAWFRDGDPKWDDARNSELGPAPGYVAGGPNPHYCDDQPKEHACTRSLVRAQPPGKAYVDTNTGWEPTNPYDKSWELSEPGIYYQAAYIRLVSKFVN
jgi:endoglucanase